MIWKPGDAIFDLDEIKKELEAAEPQQRDDGEWEKSVFLGTVMGLTPSGKVYYPFACSNVDPCPRCHGEGTITNKRAKIKRSDAAQRKAWHLRAMAMDLYGAWCNGGWPAKLVQRLGQLDAIVNHYKRDIECPRCHSLGSREAWLDQEWTTRAEEELESLSATLMSGDGNPCDYFATMFVDSPESEEEEEEEAIDAVSSAS